MLLHARLHRVVPVVSSVPLLLSLIGRKLMAGEEEEESREEEPREDDPRDEHGPRDVSIRVELILSGWLLTLNFSPSQVL